MEDKKDEFIILRVPSTLKKKLLGLASKLGFKSLSEYVRDLFENETKK
jgi:hypothetical protein